MPQTVEAFSEATSPVSIVLALDESGSMRRAAEGVKAAARSFVEALRKEDRLAVLRFSDKAELAHDLTQFRSDAMKAIDEYTSHGGTALWDAVHESNGRLRTAEGRRVVVVMTDGRDENATANGPGSVTKYDDLLEELRATGALVYAIGLGTNVDRDRLQALAASTGGEAYFPETGRGAVGRVRAHRREPAPAVRHRLHLDQQPPRRRLAGGVGDQPPARCPHRQPRRLLRAAALTRDGPGPTRLPLSAGATRCSTGAESTAREGPAAQILRLQRVRAGGEADQPELDLAGDALDAQRALVDHGAVRDEGHLCRGRRGRRRRPPRSAPRPRRTSTRSTTAAASRAACPAGRRRAASAAPAVRRSAPASPGRAAAAPDRSARSGP